tara:strand:+ start:592 stop:783 length:192 start_codon:yes stop_codon:yes gene_type:complete
VLTNGCLTRTSVQAAKEHAEFEEEEEDEEDEFTSQRQKNFMESYRNGCRGCECMSQSNCKNNK